MRNIGIVVHGGAGPDSEFIRTHIAEYQKGIADALHAGYKILAAGGNAVDAAEAAVNSMENDPFFNAGKGAALNRKAEVEMCASVMDGKTKEFGAVALVKNVKNPVSFAKKIMQETDHLYLGAEGAMEYAKNNDIELEPDAYFITAYQYEEYDKARREAAENNRDVALEEISNRMHGTVGAVALDEKGNVAAATSTGGTAYCREGRIGDSSMIGVGTYADNNTCAVSATGDGEYLIRCVISHGVSDLIRLKDLSVAEACKEMVKEAGSNGNCDIGLIAIDAAGNIALEFNCERMHRGWKTPAGQKIEIYK